MINERCLRYPDVRLIDHNNKQVGIVQTRQALRMAQEVNLDLVLVAQQAQPPVCRIVDYGKYRYEMDKKQKESKSKTKKQDMKVVKFRPSTAKGDLQIGLKKSLGFLEEGHKVKLSCQFRARELAHPKIGEAKMQWFLDELGSGIIIEKPMKLEGNVLSVIVSPNKKGGSSKDVKTQDKQNSEKTIQDNRIGENHPPESIQQPHVLAQERGQETTP